MKVTAVFSEPTLPRRGRTSIFINKAVLQRFKAACRTKKMKIPEAMERLFLAFSDAVDHNK